MSNYERSTYSSIQTFHSRNYPGKTTETAVQRRIDTQSAQIGAIRAVTATFMSPQLGMHQKAQSEHLSGGTHERARRATDVAGRRGPASSRMYCVPLSGRHGFTRPNLPRQPQRGTSDNDLDRPNRGSRGNTERGHGHRSARWDFVTSRTLWPHSCSARPRSSPRHQPRLHSRFASSTPSARCWPHRAAKAASAGSTGTRPNDRPSEAVGRGRQTHRRQASPTPMRTATRALLTPVRTGRHCEDFGDPAHAERRPGR